MVNITVVATYLISNMVYCELDSRGGIRINSDRIRKELYKMADIPDLLTFERPVTVELSIGKRLNFPVLE
jgi:hypothetical protein